MNSEERIAVFCVGNKLMCDDGLGPAVYEQLQAYAFPENIDVFDLGCLTLDRINDVRDYDLIITVDALDATGKEVGTIFRFAPEDMALRGFGSQSLHDLKLSDLFNSAALLGYECDGICLGMQVENATPPEARIGLTPVVFTKVADLVDCVLAELANRGIGMHVRATGEQVSQGFHHQMVEGQMSI